MPRNRPRPPVRSVLRRPRRTTSTPAAARPWLAPGLVAAWSLLLAWGIASGRLPGPVITLLALLVANAATFALYAADKFAAQRGLWRVRERTLHLGSLAGGWPGAWLAHRVLRHKSVKMHFQSSYRWVVGLHLALLGLWVLFAPVRGAS